MTRFEVAAFLLVALWCLPPLIVAVHVARCVREELRDARFEADVRRAGGSPEQARALLELVRDEAS